MVINCRGRRLDEIKSYLGCELFVINQGKFNEKESRFIQSY